MYFFLAVHSVYTIMTPCIPSCWEEVCGWKQLKPIAVFKLTFWLFIFYTPCWVEPGIRSPCWSTYLRKTYICILLIHSGKSNYTGSWSTQLLQPAELEQRQPSGSLFLGRSSASFVIALVSHSFIPEPQEHAAFASLDRVFSHCSSSLIGHSIGYLKKIKHSCYI